MLSLIPILSLLSVVNPINISSNQDIFGKWVTIDDESGKKRSVVEIYKKGDKAYGKIIKLFREPDEDPDPVCEECTDYRKDKKVIGMEIITDMQPEGEEWAEGEILDPENGKVYRCKIWLEGNELKVRGYLYFFYRTQTWVKAD